MQLKLYQIRAGQDPTSAKSNHVSNISVLCIGYLKNNAAKVWKGIPKKNSPPLARGHAQCSMWVLVKEYFAYRFLKCAFLFAFLCLLRADEVLHICLYDIEIDESSYSIILTLPFRKTHQQGSMLFKDQIIFCTYPLRRYWAFPSVSK